MSGWLPELLTSILASVLAITLHEAAHGYAALALGDDTAKQAGRISLNPLRHVDQVGTILLPGFLLLTQLLTVGRVDFMFGWAKPVPVNILALRNPRQGMMLVAAAGPAMNFVLALLAGFLLHQLVDFRALLSPDSFRLAYQLLGFFILANLVLGLFYLMSSRPLVGGSSLAGLLPRALALPYMQLERRGILIVLLVVVLLPRVTEGFDPVGWALRSVVARAVSLVLYLSGGGA